MASRPRQIASTGILFNAGGSAPPQTGLNSYLEQLLYLQMAPRVQVASPFGYLLSPSGRLRQRRRSALALAPLKGARQSLYAGEPLLCEKPLRVYGLRASRTLCERQLPGSGNPPAALDSPSTALTHRY